MVQTLCYGPQNRTGVRVDVDGRCPVLVLFLLCPPKGPLWGAAKAEPGQQVEFDIILGSDWDSVLK